MNAIEDGRRCGFCGATKSVTHCNGRPINQWYRNAEYGWLCRACHARIVRTGDITYKRLAQKAQDDTQRAMAIKEANAKICGGKRVIDARKLYRKSHTAQEEPYQYTILCTRCGKKTKWSKSIAEYNTSWNSVCNCVALDWEMQRLSKMGHASTVRYFVLDRIRSGDSKPNITKELHCSRQYVDAEEKNARMEYRKRAGVTLGYAQSQGGRFGNGRSSGKNKQSQGAFREE